MKCIHFPELYDYMVIFITVPLKTTTEIDFIKPLSKYVKKLKELSADKKQQVSDAIVELTKLRNRACLQVLEKNHTSLEILTCYYDQLNAIESKLPITPTQNPINFEWKDAFIKGFSLSIFSSKSASLTINDSSFERACVLFNCGAMMSEVAGTQPMNTDEELKATAKLFQQAAGVFTRLKNTILDLGQQEPTSDLMTDTLAALSVLMLAQAQEAIYIKATKDQMKASALVKISAQCAEYYQEALKLMSKDTVKGIWEQEWLNVVSGKSLALSAIAQYHQAHVSEEAKEIGEQISRLKEAHRLMEKCNNYLPLVTHYSSEIASIKKFLDQSIKDNNFIYHERIPDFSTLAPLPKAVLAKPIPINHPISPRFKDLFSALDKEQTSDAETTNQDYTDFSQIVNDSINILKGTTKFSMDKVKNLIGK